MTFWLLWGANLFNSASLANTLTLNNFSLNTVLHFAGGTNKFYENVPKSTEILNLKPSSKTISILRAGFKSIGQSMEDIAESDIAFNEDQSKAAAVIGPALCYPNPFRQINGTVLGYRLSKNMDIEIHVYDMLSNIIFKTLRKAGDHGARTGYNKLALNMETFDGITLSAGVYFYVLVHYGTNKVLASGKMAVIP